MRDCKVTMEVRKGKIDICVENASVVEMATLAGYLQHMAGMEAYKHGGKLDDIRNNMLDVHLAAMEELVQEARESQRADGIDGRERRTCVDQ